MKSKAQVNAEAKRRKWILGLGFSEAEADSFIKFEVPNWKIEALAKVIPPKPEPEPEVRDTTEPREGDTPDQGE
ncbi:hypothetical protein ES707_09198 [subsurface metagenome]